MQPTRFIPAIALACLVALSLLACGGDGDSAAASSGSPDAGSADEDGGNSAQDGSGAHDANSDTKTEGGSVEVPSAPDGAAWRVTDAVEGGKVHLAVDVIPDDATAIEYQVNGGSWAATDVVAPGVFSLSDLSDGTAVDVALRFRNSLGAGAASGPKSVTPSAGSDTRLAVWADGEGARKLNSRPTAAGSTSDQAEGTNRDIPLVGGGHAFVVDWDTSPMKVHQKTPNLGDDQGHWLLVEPGGSTSADLKPAAVETRILYVNGNEVTVSLLGAGGMFTYPLMALWGFDGDGDPVPFRFTKEIKGGRLPDGRPFVIGPVEVAHNGGDPVAVTPDPARGYVVVEDRGAELAVVVRPGVIPPAGAEVTPLDLSHAYVRRKGAYGFAGWDDTAAANGGSDGLLLRPTFETCGVYLTSPSSTVAQVRFRKKESSDAWGPFHPAQDLFFDPRASGGPAFIAAAQHRNAILYLEPGTTYEVQVKQGSDYWRKEVSTQALKVPKVLHALGDIDGDLSISRSGDTVTINPGDIQLDVPADEWVEVHSGRVRRGGVTFSGDKIILRNVDVFGAPQHAIWVNSTDIRVVGGRTAWWGNPNSRYWGTKNSGAMRIDSDARRPAVLGRFIGTPRWPSNTWAEYYDENETHPFGPRPIEGHPDEGLMVIDGCYADSHETKGFNDIVAQSGGSGPGADSIIAWCWFSGMRDDGVEFEGLPSNTIVMHTAIVARNDRMGVKKDSGKYLGGVKSFISVQGVPTGPSLSLRNLFYMKRCWPENETNGYKIQQREHPKHASITVVYHNTIAYEWWLSDPTAANAPFIASGGLGIGGFKLKNSLVIMKNSGTGGVDVDFVGPPSSEVEASTYKSFTPAEWSSPKLHPDFTPMSSATDIAGAGSEIFNLNDGGPWYETNPSIGALRTSGLH